MPSESAAPKPSMQDMQSPVDRIQQWLDHAEIRMNANLMQIQYSDKNETGFRVVARRDIHDSRTAICAIPKDAILSIKNCGIADILEEADIGGLLGLAIAVMFERAQGDQSPWHGYLQTLPDHEPIPLFWSSSELDRLAGTSAFRRITRDTDAMHEEYNETILPLIQAYPNLFPADKSTFSDFAAATSLVTSRAFNVDAYHGDAMVPLADLFNHKTDGEHVHFEAFAAVCPYCGSDGSCMCEFFGSDHDEDGHEHAGGCCSGHDHDGHDHDDAGSEESWTDDDEDDTHHDDIVEESIDEQESDDDDDSCPSELYATDSEPDHHADDIYKPEDKEKDMIEMVMVRGCKSGDEIFNTYGKQSNEALLCRYGFVESGNPYSTVALDAETILECAQTVRAEAWKSRSSAALNAVSERKRISFIEEDFQQLMHEVLDRIKRRERANQPAQASSDDAMIVDDDADSDVADDIDVERLYIPRDGMPPIVTLAFVTLAVAPESLMVRWRADGVDAVDFFDRIVHGAGSDGVWDGASALQSAVAETIARVCRNHLSEMDESVSVLSKTNETAKSNKRREKIASLLVREEREILERTLNWCDQIHKQTPFNNIHESNLVSHVDGKRTKNRRNLKSNWKVRPNHL